MAKKNYRILQTVEHGKHWHYLYRKRRRRALGINGRQMAWSQVVSLIGAVMAGVLLESNKTTLALVAGAFVVLPGVFDLASSLGAALSAKINHQLEDDQARVSLVFLSSVGYALAIALLAGLLVAGVGATVAVWFFGADFWQVFALTELAICLSALVGFPLIGALSLVFRKIKVNPDDVVGPIEASLFFILSVVMMTFVIGWLVPPQPWTDGFPVSVGNASQFERNVPQGSRSLSYGERGADQAGQAGALRGSGERQGRGEGVLR